MIFPPSFPLSHHTHTRRTRTHPHPRGRDRVRRPSPAVDDTRVPTRCFFLFTPSFTQPWRWRAPSSAAWRRRPDRTRRPGRGWPTRPARPWRSARSGPGAPRPTGCPHPRWRRRRGTGCPGRSRSPVFCLGGCGGRRCVTTCQSERQRARRGGGWRYARVRAAGLHQQPKLTSCTNLTASAQHASEAWGGRRAWEPEC